MTIKLLRLLIITGNGDLEAEKDNIVSNAKQYLDSIQLANNNLYKCASDKIQFFLYFETRQAPGENAIILKPIISEAANTSAFNLAPYIKILLKIIEDYEIYSLRSVDSDSVEMPQ